MQCPRSYRFLPPTAIKMSPMFEPSATPRTAPRLYHIRLPVQATVGRRIMLLIVAIGFLLGLLTAMFAVMSFLRSHLGISTPRWVEQISRALVAIGGIYCAMMPINLLN